MKGDIMNELEYRRKEQIGIEFTLTGLKHELKRLGYRLDRSMDSRSTARWLTGERSGESYPCITTGIKESDTGKSAFHFEARRDKNFESLQKLRIVGAYVPMNKGYLLEI
jgi:hypothetical protein